MPFIDSMDIANRALFHCGAPLIQSPDEVSERNTLCSFAYDKLRSVELRRNVWTFATRRVCLRAVDTSTFLLAPAQWDASVTYLPGAIVADVNGLLWFSTVPENLNQDPAKTTAWERYFGPLTVHLYDATMSYYQGELVYKPGTRPGSFAIFMSLQATNADDPDTTTPWDATVTYNSSDVVSYLGAQWRSLIEVNTNITPADGPLEFDISAVYATGQLAVGLDGYIYSSVSGNNRGHDPVLDTGVNWTNTNVPNAWSRVPVQYPSSQKWLPIYASMQNLAFTYPIGSGPSSQSTTSNVFRLPAGHIRKAPQNPKAGMISYLGAPGGAPPKDWTYEGQYIISRDVGPILYRFVADITLVTDMDEMFCEGLACRIGLEVCEPITQSTSKMTAIGTKYRVYMGDARIINAIEEGFEEPEEDDYILCRM
jgi:hypothetical protein